MDRTCIYTDVSICYNFCPESLRFFSFWWWESVIWVFSGISLLKKEWESHSRTRFYSLSLHCVGWRLPREGGKLGHRIRILILWLPQKHFWQHLPGNKGENTSAGELWNWMIFRVSSNPSLFMDIPPRSWEGHLAAPAMVSHVPWAMVRGQPYSWSES